MDEKEKKLVEKWKSAMIKDAHYEVEKHLDLVEEQLVSVSGRLYDVANSFDVLLQATTGEKRVLIQHGQPFAYQQGIIDVVTELMEYASGKRNLKEDIDGLKDAIFSEIDGEEEETGGIYQ